MSAKDRYGSLPNETRSLRFGLPQSQLNQSAIVVGQIGRLEVVGGQLSVMSALGQ
jgi:hypothetical protein